MSKIKDYILDNSNKVKCCKCGAMYRQATLTDSLCPICNEAKQREIAQLWHEQELRMRR